MPFMHTSRRCGYGSVSRPSTLNSLGHRWPRVTRVTVYRRFVGRPATLSLAAITVVNSLELEQLQTLFLASLAPVLKVCLLSGIGAYLSKNGILTTEGRRVVSQLVFFVFTPCLIFSKLGETVTIEDLAKYWPLAMNQLLAGAAGGVIGYGAASLSHAPRDLAPQVALTTALGNVGNLPLVLVGTLALDPHLSAILKIQDVDVAISYVMIGWFWGSFWQFPLAYLVLRPKADAGIDSGPRGATDPDNDTMDNVRLQNTSTLQISTNGLQDLTLDIKKVVESAIPILRGVFTPPTLSCFAALYVSSSPQLKDALFAPGGALKFLGDTADMLGAALIPCMILVLGANLEKGPGEAQVPPRLLATVVLTRLVIMPCVMTALLFTLYNQGLFEIPNPTYLFVMLLIHTTPTAILVHTIATVHQNKESEVSAFLFWEYLASAVSMPVFMAFYLHLIEGIA